jgi:ribulose-phosphate 3-epimerase
MIDVAGRRASPAWKMRIASGAASVLSADFAQLGDQLRECFASGISHVHVDVMDGQFVPNLSMGPAVLRAVRRVADEGKASVAVHLMIVQPERFLETFVEAGAQRVTVHVENAPLLARTLRHIRELGAEAGVAINPATPLVMLEPILELAALGTTPSAPSSPRLASTRSPRFPR